MEVYFAVCAGLATVALAVPSAVAVWTLWEVRKAAISFQRLSSRLEESAQTVRNIVGLVDHFTGHVQSGWMRGAEMAYGLVASLVDRLRGEDDGGSQARRPGAERETEGGRHV